MRLSPRGTTIQAGQGCFTLGPRTAEKVLSRYTPLDYHIAPDSREALLEIFARVQHDALGGVTMILNGQSDLTANKLSVARLQTLELINLAVELLREKPWHERLIQHDAFNELARIIDLQNSRLTQLTTLVDYFNHFPKIIKLSNKKITTSLDYKAINPKDKFEFDQALLASVMMNLIANAKKASEDQLNPQIKLELSIESPRGLPRRLHIKLSNSGQFPEKFIAKAGRARQTTKLETHEHGHGLRSATEKIKAHGGEGLTINNTKDQMAEISFYIEEMDGDRPKYPKEI